MCLRWIYLPSLMVSLSTIVTYTESATMSDCTIPSTFRPAPACASIWSLDLSPTATSGTSTLNQIHLWRYHSPLSPDEVPCFPLGTHGYNYCGLHFPGTSCPQGFSDANPTPLITSSFVSEIKCCPSNFPSMYITNNNECQAVTYSADFATPVQYNGVRSSLTLNGNDIIYHARYIGITQQPMSSMSSLPSILPNSTTTTSAIGTSREKAPNITNSKGTQVGIGIGALAGVLAVVTGIYIFWKRQRRRSLLEAGNVTIEMEKYNGPVEMNGNGRKGNELYELSSARDPGELDSISPSAELDSRRYLSVDPRKEQ